jgi:hypothetical protein
LPLLAPFVDSVRDAHDVSGRCFSVGPRQATIEFHDGGAFLEGFVFGVLIARLLGRDGGDEVGTPGDTTP